MPYIGLSRPPEQPLANPIDIGMNTPNELWILPDKWNLVVFLRHTGCPFAEALLKALSEMAAHESGLACSAICHGKKAVTQRWIEGFNLSPELHLEIDETRLTYGRWGVGYSGIGHLLHPMMLVSLLKLVVRGIRNRDASGTRWQQQVCFLIDELGVLRWCHFPKHAGDLPDLIRLQEMFGF